MSAMFYTGVRPQSRVLITTWHVNEESRETWAHQSIEWNWLAVHAMYVVAHRVRIASCNC